MLFHVTCYYDAYIEAECEEEASEIAFDDIVTEITVTPEPDDDEEEGGI